MVLLIPSILLAFSSLVELALARGKLIDIFGGEGDILQLRGSDKLRHSGSKFHNAIFSNSHRKWNVKDSSGYTVIPYTITGQFDGYEHQIIQQAMERIQKNTCIRFRPRTNEWDYIDIVNVRGEGCYTNVGRVSGRGILMLESNEENTCLEVSTVQHELLHVTGLWHEHMRYDRDNYIIVHYQNIRPGFQSQFDKVSPNEATVYNMSYDYRSVMHYGKTAFAYARGVITMQTRDPQYMDVIGRVGDASPSDYQKVCNIYGCAQCNGGGTNPWNPNPNQNCADKIPALCAAAKEEGLLDCNGNDKLYCCGTCRGSAHGTGSNPFESSYENYDDNY